MAKTQNLKSPAVLISKICAQRTGMPSPSPNYLISPSFRALHRFYLSRPSCRKQCKQTNPILTLKDPSGASWYSPKTVPDLLNIINSAPSLTKKFVVGNTSIGIYKDQNPDMWIYIRDIQELQFVGSTDSGIVVGGAATITQFIEHLDLARRADSSLKTSYIPVLLRHFKLVANTPVRNVGSVSGIP